MKKDKRAVSPLIATVLLVGFVVVLGVLFWIFSSNLVKQSLEKGNECNPTDIEQIDIKILEAKNTEGNIFEFTLKNEGKLKPAGYWVRISKGDQTQTFTTSKECSPGKECKFNYKNQQDVSSLEIIPIIVKNKKPCTALSKATTATV